MDSGLRSRLAALPALGDKGGPAIPCKICGEAAPPFDIVDLNKQCSPDRPYHFGLAGIPVVYHRCTACGFLFTALFDDWSPADFSDFIYNADYIKVDGDYVERRPRADAAVVLAMLADHRTLSVLDYGGGTGILAATLRDAGIDAVSYDPFSNPERPDRLFDLITCFEVIEHSPDPRATIRDLAGFLRDDGCVLMGTQLQPAEIDQLRCAWWYVGPRNGHVSMHSARSLDLLARTAKLTFRRGQSLVALLPTEPSAASRSIAAALGPAALTLDLVAPSKSAGEARADGGAWHEMEAGALPFRWSCRQKIGWTWTPPVSGPTTIVVRIPLVMEVEPGFAARSYLVAGGERFALTRDGDMLTATLTLDLTETVRILLMTPPPICPTDRDSRALGLAIAMAA